jgi:hypothetical protein
MEPSCAGVRHCTFCRCCMTLATDFSLASFPLKGRNHFAKLCAKIRLEKKHVMETVWDLSWYVQ